MFWREAYKGSILFFAAGAAADADGQSGEERSDEIAGNTVSAESVFRLLGRVNA